MSDFLQDLLKDSSESFEDGNYFLVTITELELGTTYPLEFRWKYKDGSFGKDWSVVKNITTPFRTSPNTPQFLSSNVTGGEGGITIEWNGKDTGGNDLTNIDRVEVWISEPPFDSTKPVYQSKTKFKTQIQAPAGAYTVALYAVTVNGQYSSVSSAYTVSVTGVAQQIDPPTLPSGLSVASAPFAVSVNWGGQYSGSGFEGFKSIDVHVRGSDVGATATSGFSTATQVATLTVDSTTNRQNIGLDNLRQALSLASNTAAYTAPMFFYYIARNQNDALYSVSGTPTYTRINSSSVNPTQANLVDLVNGIISIENLVAGNGNFSSWLRTGSAGGTRIELSAVNDFSNSGYIVQKGLVAYSSGNTEIFNLDIDAGTLTINGSGTFTGNLSIGSGNTIFRAVPATGIWLGNASEPSAPFSVSINGALRSTSGAIGGWQINPTFLQNTSGTFKISSSNTDPQIQVGADTGGHIRISASNGIGHYSSGTTLSDQFTLSPTGTSKIAGWSFNTSTIFKNNTSLNSDGSITAGSSGQFTVTTAGSMTATTGSIAGWTLDSGAIYKSSSYTDWLGNPQTLTTTLASNAKITLSSTSAPTALFNDISSVDNLLKVNHGTANTIIGPGQLEIGSTATNFGITPAKIILWSTSGDRSINIKWDGGKTESSPETNSPAKIRWWNYNTANVGERTANLWPNRDISPQSYRVLMADTDGYQWLGPIFYFSTTQATTPSNGIGADGDLYFTTA